PTRPLPYTTLFRSESARLRRSDKKEPATFAANIDGARSCGGKAKAVLYNRSDRQSVERRWRSRPRTLDPGSSTQSRRRRARRPRSPGVETARDQDGRPVVQHHPASQAIRALAENSSRESQADPA